MTKFTRTAQPRDLKPGANLLYRDTEVYVYGEVEPGCFNASFDLELIFITTTSINKFQVEIEPLKVVK